MEIRYDMRRAPPGNANFLEFGVIGGSLTVIAGVRRVFFLQSVYSFLKSIDANFLEIVMNNEYLLENLIEASYEIAKAIRIAKSVDAKTQHHDDMTKAFRCVDDAISLLDEINHVNARKAVLV